MKESLRRPILFVVIVITGSILILFDIPLIYMFPIILIVGFFILIILGAITVTDIKTALGKLKPSNLKNTGIIKKLKGIKFLKKSTPSPKDKTQPQKAEAKQTEKVPGKKKGIGLHIRSFFSSIKSLGSVLKARNKSGKKVDDINKQLDRTVREKVEKSSALDDAGNILNNTAPLPPAGAGTTGIGTTKDQDPFLSLSEDEFDSGLLDSLDELESPKSSSGITEGSLNSLMDTGSLEINETDIPLPSLDLDGEAGNILRDNAEGLEEFSGLDGGDAIDSDFGDLDNVNLEDIELDEDLEEKTPQKSATPAEPAPIIDAAPEKSDKGTVKTDWVKSDAPDNASQTEEQISTQSEMAAFSSGAGGTDSDLLSSLASEVKQVKKEKNLALLRDLKDFKAPGEEIESELIDVYTRMNAAKEAQKKRITPTEAIK
ncbi:MAG: hypothetical protein Q7U51_11755 [Methanoregula sp.]|nr:hypothetical protein [Methanoregula sp.]